MSRVFGGKCEICGNFFVSVQLLTINIFTDSCFEGRMSPFLSGREKRRKKN